MEQTFKEAQEEYIKECKEKYFKLLKDYGAKQKEIAGVKKDLKEASKWYYEKDIEKKLELLISVGVPIDKICEHPGYLRNPMHELLLKAEIAIIEDVPLDIKFLQTTSHKELVANFGARERGYLPKDRNIFYDLNGAAKIAKLSRKDYVKRFYAMKTFVRLHDKFRDEFPEFYEIFCKFPEFKEFCVHSKEKPTFGGNSAIKGERTK